MTLITFQDGKAVMRDGKVGTEQGCCCGGGQPCVCPTECVPGLAISMGNAPDCVVNESPFYIYYIDGSVVPGPCESGVVMVSQLQCIDGEWIASLLICGPQCSGNYQKTLAVGDDCLPVAGDITGWTEINPMTGPCCPASLPTVTILR